MHNRNKEIQSSSVQAFINNGDKGEVFDLHFNKGLTVDKIIANYGDFGVSRTTLFEWIKQEKERREKFKELDELWNISKSIEKGDSPEKTAYLIEFISLSGISDFSVVMGDYIWQLSEYFDLKEEFEVQLLFAEYLSVTEHLKEKYAHAYKLCNFAITQCMISPFKETPGGIKNWLNTVLDILLTVVAERPDKKTLNKVTQVLSNIYNLQMLFIKNHDKEIDEKFLSSSIREIKNKVKYYNLWSKMWTQEIERPGENKDDRIDWASTVGRSELGGYTGEPDWSSDNIAFIHTKMVKHTPMDTEILVAMQQFAMKFIEERNRYLKLYETWDKRF